MFVMVTILFTFANISYLVTHEGVHAESKYEMSDFCVKNGTPFI